MAVNKVSENTDQMTGMVNRSKLENAVQKALAGGAPAAPFVVQ